MFCLLNALMSYKNMLNCHIFDSIFHSKKPHTLYTYPNYLMRNNIEKNTNVLTFTYVFQMTTIKYSCWWEGNGNESWSRTETAHYLQNHVHTGISEDWFQQHQWAVNYIVILQRRFMKSYNADEEKTWNNAANGIYTDSIA